MKRTLYFVLALSIAGCSGGSSRDQSSNFDKLSPELIDAGKTEALQGARLLQGQVDISAFSEMIDAEGGDSLGELESVQVQDYESGSILSIVSTSSDKQAMSLGESKSKLSSDGSFETLVPDEKYVTLLVRAHFSSEHELSSIVDGENHSEEESVLVGPESTLVYQMVEIHEENEDEGVPAIQLAREYRDLLGSGKVLASTEGRKSINIDPVARVLRARMVQSSQDKRAALKVKAQAAITRLRPKVVSRITGRMLAGGKSKGTNLVPVCHDSLDNEPGGKLGFVDCKDIVCSMDSVCLTIKKGLEKLVSPLLEGLEVLEQEQEVRIAQIVSSGFGAGTAQTETSTGSGGLNGGGSLGYEGQSCSSNDQCAPDEFCNIGVCMAADCTSDDECFGGTICSQGQCMDRGAIMADGGGNSEACGNGPACEGNFECIDGKCQINGNPRNCEADNECMAGLICLYETCSLDPSNCGDSFDLCMEHGVEISQELCHVHDKGIDFFVRKHNLSIILHTERVEASKDLLARGLGGNSSDDFSDLNENISEHKKHLKATTDCYEHVSGNMLDECRVSSLESCISNAYFSNQ